MESININKSNYEIYLIDYLDGTLAPELEQLLLAFLNDNPDIQEEIEGLEWVRIEPQQEHLDCTMTLKKNVPETGSVRVENFEEYCIAYYEGDLSAEEKTHVQNFIAEYPEYKPIFTAYAQIRLLADTDKTLPQKTSLYHNAVDAGESINTENYPDFVIASLEHDLTDKQEQELQHFLYQNERAKKEAAVYAGLRLQADTSIQYPGKSALKRRSIAIPAYRRQLAGIAAAILILISFYLLWERPATTPYKTTAIARHTLDQKLHIRSLAPGNNKIEGKQIIQNTALAANTPVNKPTATTLISGEATASAEDNSIKIVPVETRSIAFVDIPSQTIEIETSALNYADYLQRNSAKEEGIVVNGLAGRMISRFSNLLSKSDRLKKDRLRGQMRNLAEIAVNSYNVLVESERNPMRNTEDGVNP
jgi:hypothetical protein